MVLGNQNAWQLRKVAAFKIMFENFFYPADKRALHFGLSANIFGLQTIWIHDNLKKNNIKLFNLRRPFTIFLGACIFVFMNSHLGTIWWVFKSEIKKNSLYTYLILEDHLTRNPPPPPETDKEIQLGEIK